MTTGPFLAMTRFFPETPFFRRPFTFNDLSHLLPFFRAVPLTFAPLIKLPTYQTGALAAKIVSFPYAFLQVYPDISSPET
jgi:hypothetical protein